MYVPVVERRKDIIKGTVSPQSVKIPNPKKET